MKQFVLKALVVLVAFTLLSIVMPSVSAGDEPNGKPFLALSERIDDLESQINDMGKWDKHGTDIAYMEGNVGIGTTTPATKLHVEGIITAAGGNSNDWNTAYGWGDHAAVGYDTTNDKWTGAGNTYVLSGNVGIGTSTPLFNLEVYRDHNAGTAIRVSNPNIGTASTAGIIFDYTGGEYAAIHARGANHASVPDHLQIINNHGTGSVISFVTNGGQRMNIDDIGNVGIGTTSPSAKLGVAGNIHATGTITSGSSITIDGTNDKITASTGTINFDDEKLVTTGNVGIGTTSPVTRLHVHHDIGGQWAAKVVNPSTTGLGMTVDTGSSDPGYLAFRIRTGDVNRFWVVNDGTAYFSGNVGIGTQSPSEKLDVVGNIHASGTITSGSSITIDGTHDKITASGGTIDFDNENLVTTGKVGIGTMSPIGPFEVKTGNKYGPAVLDQSQTTIKYYATNSKDVWQSFTAGKTGKLEIVSLYISTLTNPSETIRIYKGEGTGGTLLYTASSIYAPANKWLTHTLTSSIDVTSGSKYTIRLSTSSGSGCYWGGINTNPYAGGKGSFGSSWDMQFKTYVATAVPELLVDTNGNVGIGTASPTSVLHVVGLPSYSSNAAAVSGGLTVGAFYRNGDNVCVAH